MYRRHAFTLIASLFVASGLWLAGCDVLKGVISNADPIEECIDSKLYADKRVCIKVEYKDKVPVQTPVEGVAVK